MIEIGYACLKIGDLDSKFSSLRMKNVNDDRLVEIIEKNLHSLENILLYNKKNNIKLFRISSDIIPFGSHSINKVKWWIIFKDQLDKIATIIKESNQRVSMHPGQYTILNSPKKEVVENSIKEIEYHCRFLESIGCDVSSKIVLHIGGIYNDKTAAIERFISVFNSLSNSLKERIIIENDDTNYNIEDVLSISRRINTPVVFDNLHHSVNKSMNDLSEREIIILCLNTWKKKDGIAKIHYSQSRNEKNLKAHSFTINGKTFLDFFNQINNLELNIMLEVKDKNISAIKCKNIITENIEKSILEKQWAIYKMLVLSKSPKIYFQIKKLFINEKVDALKFYNLIDKSVIQQQTKGNMILSLEHIFGHLKKRCTKKEKAKFVLLLNGYKEGRYKYSRIFKFLLSLAINQKNGYILNSLIFYYE